MTVRFAIAMFGISVGFGVGIGTAGCGASHSSPAVAYSSPWVESALGEPAQIILVARYAALMQDTRWNKTIPIWLAAAAVDRSPASRALELLQKVERAELYVTFGRGGADAARMFAVFRDVPASLSPHDIPDGDGRPVYGAPRILPSGVAAFDPKPGARGWLFVYPNRTWVVADAETAPRIASTVALSATPPPAPDVGDALASITLGPAVLEQARARGWLTASTAYEALVVDIGPRAKEARLLARYANEDLAARAEQEARATPMVSRVKVTLKREGRELVATIDLSDTLAALDASGHRPLPPPPSLPAAAPDPSAVPSAPPPAPRMTIAQLPAALDCTRAIAPLPPPSRPRMQGPPPTAGQMTEQAAQAKRLFDSEKWNDAFLALTRVAIGETGDDEGNRHLAQYHAAVALFRLRKLRESAAAFRAIATDTRHLKHNETLLWLVKLAAEDPALVQLADFAHYEKHRALRFDNPQQQDILGGAAYFVGLHRRAIGNAAEARELFERVPADHPYAPSARRCMR